jgi:hypothetical protein
MMKAATAGVVSYVVEQVAEVADGAIDAAGAAAAEAVKQVTTDQGVSDASKGIGKVHDTAVAVAHKKVCRQIEAPRLANYA